MLSQKNSVLNYVVYAQYQTLKILIDLQMYNIDMLDFVPNNTSILYNSSLNLSNTFSSLYVFQDKPESKYYAVWEEASETDKAAEAHG